MRVNLINSILGRYSMYQLMLWYLRLLIFFALVLSALAILPYSAWQILMVAVYLVSICYLTNRFFGYLYKIKTNPESAIITGAILTLILGPLPLLPNLLFLTLAALASQASKYLLTLRRRHLFNPTALGVMVTALLVNQGATWWIGGIEMLPFVMAGGLLMARKIRRFKMVGSFLGAYLILSALGSGVSAAWGSLLYSPILFFGFVMLVEPQTSPSRHGNRIYYGLLVAAVFFVLQQTTTLPYTLELSLLLGNLFAFIGNPIPRLVQKLQISEQIASGAMGFWFEPRPAFGFVPGQFLEWTLAHPHSDSRGIRRYFTIASSPTEQGILLATKFSSQGSTFKTALRLLQKGEQITVTGPRGDFVLPKEANKKLVFIAGGIGITPFRSMIKYLLDMGQPLDIVLLYSNKTREDIAFRDLFDEAIKKFQLKVVYVNTDEEGFLDLERIKKEVPDWPERLFYVSGPEPMVQAFEKMLEGMGVPKANIKRDYFPGYTETHTG